MVKPTQRDRVLRALRRAGRLGVTQLDADAGFNDGHLPVRRLASRIEELRDRGHLIDSRGRRHRMAVYVLVRSPEPPQAPCERPEDAPSSLFGAAGGAAPPRGAYDDADA